MYEVFAAGRISYEEWASRAFEQYVKKGANKGKPYKAIEYIKPTPEALCMYKGIALVLEFLT